MLKQAKVVGWLLLAGMTAVTPFGSSAQALDTLSLVGSLMLPAGQGSEVWGWTAPDGTEYGIMGYQNGMAFIRTTPTIQLVDTVGGPMLGGGTPWREMKTYGHYCYLVSEATGTRQGLSVFDMQYLPDSVKYIGSFSTNGAGGFTGHTISIDTATGYCYVERSQTQPVCVLSLANPEVPTFVSFFDTSATMDIHDMTAINDTVYVAEGFMGSWSVWDLTNKTNPVMLVRVTIPGTSNYVHNVWPSPDKQYCATTEELPDFRTVKFWDISDLQNVQIMGEYLGPAGLPHNAHWMSQDTLVLSHYESGLILLDVSDPNLPVRIGSYDTYPASNLPEFRGCWGAYPYTQNGYIYGSNIDGQFFVVELRCIPTLDGPALLGPADSMQNLLQPITLAWADNGAIGYRVEVDSDPAFGSPDRDTVLTDTTLDLSGLPYPVTYYWRVSAETSECGLGPASAPNSFEAGCIVQITGDLNENGVITSGDIVLLVNYVFKSGAPPQPVPEAGDINCSSDVTSADVIRLVNFVFKGGIPPCDVCTII